MIHFINGFNFSRKMGTMFKHFVAILIVCRLIFLGVGFIDCMRQNAGHLDAYLLCWTSWTASEALIRLCESINEDELF